MGDEFVKTLKKKIAVTKLVGRPTNVVWCPLNCGRQHIGDYQIETVMFGRPKLYLYSNLCATDI